MESSPDGLFFDEQGREGAAEGNDDGVGIDGGAELRQRISVRYLILNCPAKRQSPFMKLTTLPTVAGADGVLKAEAWANSTGRVTIHTQSLWLEWVIFI